MFYTSFQGSDPQHPFNEQLFNILFYHHWRRHIPFPYCWELIKPCSEDSMNHFHLVFLWCLLLMYLYTSPMKLSSEDGVNGTRVLFSPHWSKGAEGISEWKEAVSFRDLSVIPRTRWNVSQALLTVHHCCSLQLLSACFCRPHPEIMYQKPENSYRNNN